MAKINDGMRGRWHFTGQYWMCDCYVDGPLLQIGFGQGGQITSGKPQSPNVSRCSRCGILRPLKRDKPELTDTLPHGIKRAVYKNGELHELDDNTHG